MEVHTQTIERTALERKGEKVPKTNKRRKSVDEEYISKKESGYKEK
jgi:hypothetical protein